jgi:hypothetical protein
VDLTVQKIPKSEVILIPVANENLKDIKFATDIDFIHCGEKSYEVFDFFEQEKDDPIHQRALFYMALGKNIFSDSLWKAYPNSHKIFLFVCKETEGKKEVKVGRTVVTEPVKETQRKVEVKEIELDL